MPAAVRDRCEAVQILVGIADYCEKVARGEETPESGELDGFLFPHWNDQFDRIVDRTNPRRGMNASDWETELRTAIAWRCRLQLYDIAMTNDCLEQAYEHARAAVQSLPNEANARLRLARVCMQLGNAVEAAEQYRECLRQEPLLIEAWPEQVTALTAADKPEEAEKFVQDCLKLTDAIPMLRAVKWNSPEAA